VRHSPTDAGQREEIHISPIVTPLRHGYCSSFLSFFLLLLFLRRARDLETTVTTRKHTPLYHSPQKNPRIGPLKKDAFAYESAEKRENITIFLVFFYSLEQRE
jgi:hypothetical protein